MTFDIFSSKPVTVTNVSGITQNELDGRPYDATDTTVGGTSLPSTIDRFVELTDPEADMLVTLEFADGSSQTLGIA